MRQLALRRPMFFRPDPILVMLGIAILAGLLIQLAGPRLGMVAIFHGSALPLEQAPDFKLSDQFGHSRSIGQFSGGPVVLTFLYTSCEDVCPTTADKLRVTYDLLGKDAAGLTFMAVSVDPARDTVEQARDFAEGHGPPQGWYFLTGTREQLEPVWKDYHVGVIAPDRTDGSAVEEIAHAAPVFVVDSEGYRRLSYDPSFDPAQMADDLRLLLWASGDSATFPSQ